MNDAAAQPDFLRFVKNNIRDYALLLSLLVIMVFFQYTTNGTLFKPVNMTNLILQNSYIVIMALGMLLVIVAGHIDLSVGSVSGFIGAIAAVLMVTYKVDVITSVILCVALGAFIGGVQGYFTAYYKIPAFIVTLAGMLIFKGLALTVLGGASVGPFPNSFQLLSTGFIPDFIEGPFNWTAILIGMPNHVEDDATLGRQFESLGPVEDVSLSKAGRVAVPLRMRIGSGFKP